MKIAKPAIINPNPATIPLEYGCNEEFILLFVCLNVCNNCKIPINMKIILPQYVSNKKYSIIIIYKGFSVFSSF